MNYHTVSSFEKRPAGPNALVLPFMKSPDSKELPKPLFQLSSLGMESHGVSAIMAALNAGAFKGKEGEALLVYVDSPYEKRVVLVGLSSDGGVLSSESIRASYAAAVSRVIQEEGVSSLVIALPNAELFAADIQASDYFRMMDALLDGVGFGLYRFSKYFKTHKGSSPHDIFFIHSSIPLKKEQVDRSQALVSAVAFARDMVNMSACEMTPDGMAQMALTLETLPGVHVEVHDKKWIEDQKMGLFLAVAQGSSIPPKFVIIDYKGEGASSLDRTVIIGKGITFDTGGLNIKPTGSMETMRVDMAGAASVIAVMKAVSELKLPLWLTALVPLTDNAVDGNSFRPGDVFYSREGSSVEIVSTDAEGRLILADALHYAQTELSPSRVIDVATLTGASEIALGTEISALFCNSDALALSLEYASKRSGEPIWRLPLHKRYKPLLKSDYADMKNSSGRAGGAINAALFLEHFIGNIPWAHFDIASTAYSKEGRSYFGKGATAVPVRTLFEYFIDLERSVK